MSYCISPIPILYHVNNTLLITNYYYYYYRYHYFQYFDDLYCFITTHGSSVIVFVTPLFTFYYHYFCYKEVTLIKNHYRMFTN